MSQNVVMGDGYWMMMMMMMMMLMMLMMLLVVVVVVVDHTYELGSTIMFHDVAAT